VVINTNCEKKNCPGVEKVNNYKSGLREREREREREKSYLPA